MKRFYPFILAAVLLMSGADIFAQSTTFTYTGGMQTFSVNTGVYLLAVDMYGACGAPAGPSSILGTPAAGMYGLGGRTQATLSVTPGQILNIFVGGQGTTGNGSGATGGYNGGGSAASYGGSYSGGSGGGCTDIRIGGIGFPANTVVVAGGGGGGGYNGGYYTGGAGGGLTGGTANGTGGGSASTGGSQVAGGIGGLIGGYTQGSTGTQPTGGSSQSPSPGIGAGGGGGYWGGGGGCWNGGGGGSCYANSSVTSGASFTQAYPSATGNGQCTITVLCTVPTSGPISGTTNICPGISYNFTTTSSSGGTWSSTNTSVATVNATTGVVTAVAPGTATISYSDVVSCGAALVAKPIVVNPLPVAITGTANACKGLTTSLSDGTSGGKWSSSNTTSITINSTTGVLTGVALGTSIITYQVTATSCYATQVETVNVLPNIYTTGMVGSGTYCSGGTGFHITLSNTDAGVSYQLSNSGSPIGSPATGSGSPYDFGLETLAGPYTVVATNIASQCPIAMAGAPTITVNPLPTQYPVTVSSGGNYCSGGTGVDIQLTASDPGVNYQLYNGALAVGAPLSSPSGALLDFGMQTGAGTYTIAGTNSSTTCMGNMSNSVAVNINPLPNVYTITGGGSYCAGGTGVHVGLSGSDAGINYQLFVGGVSSGITKTGTGSPIDFGAITMSGACTVVANNPVTGCTNNMSSGISVGINALPSVYNVTGGGNYCSGGTGQHVDLSFSGSSGITYQLYRLFKGTNTLVDSLSGTGSSLDFGSMTIPGVPGDSGTFTVVAINTTTQCSNAMSGNAIIKINTPPFAFLMTNGGAYCAGGAGALVRLNGSATGTSYQLLVGGSPVGSPVSGTGGILSFGSQKAAGVYTAVATSGTTGCSAPMNGSVTVSINPAPTAYAILTPTGSSYCANVAGTQIKLGQSDVGIRYQIYSGGVALTDTQALRNGTGFQLDFGIRAAGTYTIIGTNAITGCTNTMSGSPLVTVNPLPLVDTVTGGGSYCTGGTGSHVGLSYSTIGVNYQLSYSGSAIGSPLAGTGGPLDFGLETGKGSYTVMATNAATGCMSNMSGSVAVSTTALPTIYATTGGGNYCAGSGGVHVGLSASNTGINYQLYNGTVPVGGTVHGTGLSLDFGLQSITGTYTVQATNASTSCTSNMSGNAIVNVNLLPSIYSVIGGGNYCSGGTGKDVSTSNSDMGTNYQLYYGSAKSGGIIMGTGSGIDFGMKTIPGTYTVQAMDAVTGCSVMLSGNALINTLPLPSVFTVSGGGAFCSGGSGEHVYLSGTNIGINYQLYDNTTSTGLTPISGTGTKIDFGAQTAGGNYTVVATDAVSGCTNNMFSSATIIVNALPQIDTVTGGGYYCAGATGLKVGLNGSSLGINYQVSVGGSTIGLPSWGSGSSLDLGVFTAAGAYSVQAMNAATGCTSAMYSTITVNITPVVKPTVTVTADLGLTVCDSSLVTYTATGVNSGTSPVYAWYVNGVLVPGADTATFAYMPPATGTTITGELMSSAMCAVPANVSNTVTMVVNPHGMPDITISEDPGTTVCKGTGVTLSALLPAFAGSAPTYQWMVGGTPVGTGNTYMYVPSNNDVVSLQMNSNDMCRLSDSVVKSVTMTVESPVAPVFTIKSKSSGILGASDTLQAVITSNGGPSPTYQWVVNGQPLLGQTKSIFVTSNLFNGDSVACIVTGSGNCGGLPSSQHVIMSIHGLSVGQVNGTSMDIRVIPNPNRGSFMIKGTMGHINDGAVSVEITNMLGQVVYRGTGMVQGGQLAEQVDMTGNISNGMYLLSISSGADHAVFHFVIEQ